LISTTATSGCAEAGAGPDGGDDQRAARPAGSGPDGAAIHERSDGIPLHVEELLAAVDEDTLTPQSGAAIQAATVPDTPGDAVLSRVRHLAANIRDVASAAAVIGRSFDFDLLTVVTGRHPDEVASSPPRAARRSARGADRSAGHPAVRR
jgi:hypothetical protein